MTAMTPDEAEAFLYREALLLDEGDYDAWLDLFMHDAVFWMPAWRNESEQTDDPDRELSLIYYQGRRNLEDHPIGPFGGVQGQAQGDARDQQRDGDGTGTGHGDGVELLHRQSRRRPCRTDACLFRALRT